jgi:hypothetical protein
MRLLVAILLFIVGIIFPSVLANTDKVTTARRIQDIDFRNFIYPFWDDVFAGLDKRITAHDGVYCNKEDGEISYQCFAVADIQYGRIIGERADQAVVSVVFGSVTGNWYRRDVYIYTLRDGKPALLTILKESRIEKDFMRFGGEDFWEATKDIKVSDGGIKVSHFVDGAHCCPENVASFHYLYFPVFEI